MGSPTQFRRKATRGGGDPVPRWVSYEALAEPAQAGKSRPQKFALYERYFLYLYEREAFAARSGEFDPSKHVHGRGFPALCRHRHAGSRAELA